MYSIAIFDLDGTLLNTIDDLAASGNHALRVCGYPEHSVDAYKIYIGDGLRNLIIRALPPQVRDDAAVQERVEALFSEYYRVHSQDLTAPYEGVAEALAGLKEAGVRIGVLSNKPDRFTGLLVERFFPGLVDIAYGQRKGVPIKPDPAAVYEIIAAMGAEKEACVYIGDTGTDMETGANAGLPTVGVLWGFRTKEELEAQGAHHIIDKPSQLLTIILDKSDPI